MKEKKKEKRFEVIVIENEDEKREGEEVEDKMFEDGK